MTDIEGDKRRQFFMVGDEPDAVILDLDAYRKRRESEGTWPISKEDHLAFFREWRQKKLK